METKIETKIVYFSKVSPDTTDTTLSIAKQRAGELGIKTILVASTFGDTGVKAVDVFKGYKVVVVGHSYGHRGPNMTPFADEKRKYIESKGGVVYFAPEAFVGLGLSASRASAPGGCPPAGQVPILRLETSSPTL